MDVANLPGQGCPRDLLHFTDLVVSAHTFTQHEPLPALAQWIGIPAAWIGWLFSQPVKTRKDLLLYLVPRKGRSTMIVYECPIPCHLSKQIPSAICRKNLIPQKNPLMLYGIHNAKRTISAVAS
jgi:hypothetical protein